MTTLKIQNIVCPHCQNKMYTIGVMSFIIRNSEVFSDGKVISNPSRPSEQNILICSKCYEAFWKDDAQIDNETPDYLLDNLPEANSVMDLFPGFEPNNKLKLATYFNELLNKGFATTKEREVYLRLELWRTLNDTVRYQKKPTTYKIKDLFTTNLTTLLTIFKPKGDDELLLVVEMNRELGEFEKAFELLKKINRTNDSINCKQIENAIKNNKSTVFKISEFNK